MSDWPSFVQNSLPKRLASSETNEVFVPIISDVVVEVSGVDAAKLLQGQITADIDSMAVNDFCLGALCTNKGRIVAVFTIMRSSEGFYCRLSKQSAEAFIQTLKKYGVFYKVDITLRTDIGLVAVFSNNALTGPLREAIQIKYSESLTEYWIKDNQWQDCLEALKSTLQAADESLWQLSKIKQGWPDIAAETLETFLPHALSLDLAEAISFTKGCYTGQEIIARTHYRGKPKKRLARLVLESTPEQPFTSGSNITNSEGMNLGSLVTSAAYAESCELLASISLDSPQQGTVVIEDQSVDYRLSSLPWD